MAETRTRKEIWIPRIKLMGAVFLPIFLETIDYTVVATAQTNIASIFRRLDLQSYIGTAYVLTSTVFLPIFASLADVFGRYFTMQLSVVFFLVGSAICTGSNDMITLLVGRGISGIGAAGLLTVVRIILSDSANLDDNNAQAALLVVLYSIGFSVGPVLGGALLSASWRWVFAINLPCCVVSMIVMWILLPKITKGPQPPRRLNYLPPSIAEELARDMGDGWVTKLLRLDLVGATIFISSGILILLALNWGSIGSWREPRVIACFVIGGVLLVLFVGWEWLVEHSTDTLVEKLKTQDGETNTSKPPSPVSLRHRVSRFAPKWAGITDAMIPMNMFRSYDVVSTNFAALTSGMVMMGLFYFVAIFWVLVAGRTAVNAGVQLLFFSPGIGVGVLIAVYLMNRFRQPKYPAILATLILPIALGFLADALYKSQLAKISGFMAMCGVGVGMGFAPLSIQARFTQPEDRVATVVATNLFFRTAGGTIGLAQLAAVMNTRVRTYIVSLVQSGALSPEDALRVGNSLNSLDSLGGVFYLPQALQDIVKDAFRSGLRWAFISLIPWTGVSLILVLFLSTIPLERLSGVRKVEDNHELEKVVATQEQKVEGDVPQSTNTVSERNV